MTSVRFASICLNLFIAVLPASAAVAEEAPVSYDGEAIVAERSAAAVECVECPPPSPPAPPWKPLFYDNDFSAFVDRPPYVFGEQFKLVPLTCDSDVTVSFGGQLRHRYHYEDNRLRPQGQTQTEYQLWRWRNYLDVRSRFIRVFVEGIDASNFDNDIPPVSIDVNRADIQNAFIDLNLYSDVAGGSGTFRYGRQELLFGDQHLISPLDWANTRRNFSGYRFMHKADDWRLDLFSVNPVNLSSMGDDASFNQFDHADNSRRLSGAWLTGTLTETTSADLFYLYQQDNRPVVNRADGDRHLVGARIFGKSPMHGCDACCESTLLRTWDYDLQGGYQFGNDNGQDVSAGYVNAVLGHTWNKMPWSPRLAALFYYGSGDDDPNDGTNNTFFTYHPLGHAYWGIIDNFNGQNLLDYSLQGGVNPTRKLTVVGAYHLFRKASGNDFLYNIAAANLGPLGAGSDIGNELDIIATYTFNPNFNVQAGWAHFWYGDFSEQNLVQAQGDGTLLYLQTTLNY